MYSVLIIDTIYAEALKIADILSDPAMNCQVTDIASLGFIGGQRFLKRKPDIVFLDANLCAMRIDEFLTLAKQTTHRYSVVMLINEGYDVTSLPEFCFALNKSDISRQSVGGVLKKIRAYYSDIDDSRSQKTDRELLDILLGSNSDYSLKRIVAEQIGLPAPFNVIKPILLQFRTDAEYFGVIEALDKILQKECRGRLISLGGQLAVVLLSGRQILETDALSELLKAHVNLSWVMVEDRETTLYSISSKMKRLQELSRLVYFYQNGSRVAYDDLSDMRSVDAAYIGSWADDIIGGLMNFQWQAVLDGVEEMYLTTLARARSSESLQVARLYMTEILRVLNEMASGNGVSRKVWPQHRFNSLADEYLYVAKEFSAGLERLKEKFEEHSPLVQSAISYIYGNIGRSISLQDVAASISVSKEYLCTVFRRDMEQGIVEFINKAKVMLACYMLGAGRTTKETSGALGFADSGYFERVFKKFRGITPAQYRRDRDEYKEPYSALGRIEE